MIKKTKRELEQLSLDVIFICKRHGFAGFHSVPALVKYWELENINKFEEAAYQRVGEWLLTETFQDMLNCCTGKPGTMFRLYLEGKQQYHAPDNNLNYFGDYGEECYAIMDVISTLRVRNEKGKLGSERYYVINGFTEKNMKYTENRLNELEAKITASK